VGTGAMAARLPARGAVCILGPTGVGKTRVSLDLAQRFGGEIIGVDSMQVYRHMDIGTAKATEEERRLVPHHLIDVVDPDEEYSLARYLEDAVRAASAIGRRQRPLFFVGGTGLYFRGLIQGVFVQPPIPSGIRDELHRRVRQGERQRLHQELRERDPESAARIPPQDTQRLVRALEILQATGRPWSEWLKQAHSRAVLEEPLLIGLGMERKDLYQRINQRVDLMVEQGLLDEVKKLLEMGYSPKLKPMQAIGYRHMVGYLEGRFTWEEALRLLARDTRRYAKRQFTWFKGMQGVEWFTPDQVASISRRVADYFQGERSADL